MTLDRLKSIDTQLRAQYTALLSTAVPEEKAALSHCNAIELRGALQLLGQLMTLESIELAAPPGATGPSL